MVEVGVYGNILPRSRNELKVLANKHNLYYNLSELCDRMRVKLKLDDIYHIRPAR